MQNTNEKIGNSRYGMGSAGCLISSVASAITEHGIKITPQELNDILTSVNGYSDGDLIWSKIHEAVPQVDYKYSRIFSRRTIENDLQNGLLPIVNVKFHGNGVTHWVLVVGAKDGEFLVYDPINSDMKPIPLSTHGKIFAYRAIVRSTV